MQDQEIRNYHNKLRRQYFYIIIIFFIALGYMAFRYFLFSAQANNNPIVLISIFLPFIVLFIYLLITKRLYVNMYYRLNSSKLYGRYFVESYLKKEFTNLTTNSDETRLFDDVTSSKIISGQSVRRGIKSCAFSENGDIDGSKFKVSYFFSYVGANRRDNLVRFYKKYLRFFFFDIDINRSENSFIIKERKLLINRDISDLIGNEQHFDMGNGLDVELISGNIDYIRSFVSNYSEIIKRYDLDIQLSIIDNKAYILINSDFIFRNIFRSYDGNYDLSKYMSMMACIKEITSLLKTIR